MKILALIYISGWLLLFLIRYILIHILSNEEKFYVNKIIDQIIKDPLNIRKGKS